MPCASHRSDDHPGYPTVTATTAHFNAATDINDTIATGLLPPIPANTFIIAVNSPTSVTLNHNASVSKTEQHADHRELEHPLSDRWRDHNSTTITSANADFVPGDVGRIVTGTNIPWYDTIASVTDATTAVLTTVATATGTAQSLTIGADE